MKVKISYTVDLDQVPAEAGTIIDRALDSVREMSADADRIKTLKTESLDKAIKEIDSMRMKIYEADLLLADGANMIMGYLNTISSPEQQDGSAPNMGSAVEQQE